MLGDIWTNLGYAGSFIAGLLVGMLATIRLTKALTDERRRRENGEQHER